MRRTIAKDLMRIAMQEAIRTQTKVPVRKIYKILKKQYKDGILQRTKEGSNAKYKHMSSLGKTQ